MERKNKGRERKTKKFTSSMQTKLLLVFSVIILSLVGLIGRLIYIVNTDGERYAKQVLSRQSYVSAVLPYRRGEIIDTNGSVLAQSQLQYKLIFDPKYLLNNREQLPETLLALKEHFEVSEEEAQEILDNRPESQYVILRKNIEYKKVDQYKQWLIGEEKTLRAIWFDEEYVRNYPYNNLASDVIGFTSADDKGQWGLERYYNDELTGTNGREYGYYDSNLDIDRTVKKAENGKTIVTSIDINIQRIIQKHIQEFNEEFGSENIGILLMNPNNGEIIAMASNEEYDLNNPRDLSPFYSEEELAAMSLEEQLEVMNKLWGNDVISMGFEPGSTYKPFTISAALEEGLVNENSVFECDGGEQVGGWYIRCSRRHGHGTITLGEALALSCNDVMMQVAALQGREAFYQYQMDFFFGQKTGIDLPGEASGILTELDKLNASELATSSFGQTFNVTMVQMAAAYSSVVNGGKYYQPHIVKQIINDSGATVKEFNPFVVRQLVSEETSKFIQKYMYQAVENGTARGAQVEGYAIGGKTGTAEKFPRDKESYLVSFIGGAPANNPEVVFFVIVDEPQNVDRQADSSIATKLTSRVMKEVLPALGIYPEGEIDYLLPDPDDIYEEDSFEDDVYEDIIQDLDQVDNEGEDPNNDIENNGREIDND